MTSTKGVVSLHIGQAGIQIANSLWELYSLEHDLEADGKLSKLGKVKSELGLGSFFHELPNGGYTPRALLMDLEPSVIDELKNSKNRSIFSNCTILQGNEDAANNFARGYHTVGRSLLKKALQKINNAVSNCDKLQGFMIFHSLGGGTGSGFASALIQEITEEYPDKGLLEIAVFPSRTMSTAVVEPYNTAFATSSTLDRSRCVVLTDNEAMYRICKIQLDMDNPTYNSINRVMAQAVSSITTGLRFKGDLMTDFLDFQTNLVPFPRLHFPIVSLAPVIGDKSTEKELMTVSELTGKCFDPSYRLTDCGKEWGKYIACCLMYRGDVTPKDINVAIANVKQKKSIKFVDWCPTGFKVGINHTQPMSFVQGAPVTLKRSVCMLCNNSALQSSWKNLENKFSVMSAKGAFFHWYLSEGMEQGDFIEAGDSLQSLIADYEELLN